MEGFLDKIKSKVWEISNDITRRIFSEDSEFIFMYMIVCWFGFIFIFQYLLHLEYLTLNVFVTYMLLCLGWYFLFMAMTAKQRRKAIRHYTGRRHNKKK